MLNISKSFLNGKFDVGENFRFCFNRAGAEQARNAANTAGNTISGEQASAQAKELALTPFYRSEMGAQHLFDPQQNQELLNAAAAPLAASAATTAGQARSEAARTRNTSGFSSALDQAARDRNSAMGGVGQQVAAQDIMGAKDLNQRGAAGMAGLYDTDTNAMLKAMGIQNQDINTEIEAGKSGWYQNLLAGAQTALSPFSKKV
jgi:hypothetical protein